MWYLLKRPQGWALTKCGGLTNFAWQLQPKQRSPEVVLLHIVAERPEAHAQQLCRLDLDTPRLLERFGDVAPLYLLHMRFQVETRIGQTVRARHGGTDRIAADVGRQAVGQNRRRRLERHRPLHRVLELSDVAGPLVLEQQLHRLVRDADDLLPHLLGVLRRKCSAISGMSS